MDLNLLVSSAGPPVVFMLAIWFFTFGIRRVVEKTWPGVVTRVMWQDVVLPMMPPLLGAFCAAVMYKFPFLDRLPTWGTRAFYGCVGGGGSGVLYRVIKALVKARYGVNLSMTPEASSGVPAVVIPKDAPIPEDEEITDPQAAAPEDLRP